MRTEALSPLLPAFNDRVRDRFTKEVQASVDRIAVFRQVVRVKLVEGLVTPDFVCPLAVVVVSDLLVSLVNGHGGSGDEQRKEMQLGRPKRLSDLVQGEPNARGVMFSACVTFGQS